jgi:hypothetical protein
MNRRLSKALLIVTFGAMVACGESDQDDPAADVDAGSNPSKDNSGENNSGENNSAGDNDGDNTGDNTTGGENSGNTTEGDNSGGGVDGGDSAGSAGDMDGGPVGPPSPSAAGDVVITEIQAAPVGYGVDMDEKAEWIELYNPSATVTFDLGGCTFNDKPGEQTADFTFDPGLLIAPGAYLTISSATFTVATHGFVSSAVYGSTAGLSGGGDAPILTCKGVTIDVVDYAQAGFPKPEIFEGYTIQLNPEKLNGADNDLGASWCYGKQAFSPHPNHGTPGLANEACATATPALAGDLVITEIQAAPVGYADDAEAEWIELYNPSTTTTYDLGGCTFGDKAGDADGAIATGTIVPPGAYITLSSAMFTENTHGFISDFAYPASGTGLSAGGDGPNIVCNTVTIDIAKYSLADGFPDFATTEGATAQLDPAHLTATDNDSGANWCFSTVTFFTAMTLDNKGSPRKPNVVCAP